MVRLTEEQKRRARDCFDGSFFTWEQKQFVLGEHYYPECQKNGCQSDTGTLCRRQYANGAIHYGFQCELCGRWKSCKNPGIDGLPEFDEQIIQKEKIRREVFLQKCKALEDFSEELRGEKKSEWWDWYNQYLQSPEWKSKRELVLARDRVCAGCGERRSDHVHHLTYDHVGNEFLWELVGVCVCCHQKAHPDKQIA